MEKTTDRAMRTTPMRATWRPIWLLLNAMMAMPAMMTHCEMELENWTTGTSMERRTSGE